MADELGDSNRAPGARRSARNRAARERRPPTPLNDSMLRDLALAYVARYATSQHKLAQYLARKLRERGWAGDGDAAHAVTTLADRLVDLRYIDDEAYALMRADGLLRRGYGARRIAAGQYQDGIGEDDRAAANALAAAGAWDAAVTYARRKRFGPYATQAADPALRQKQLASFLRAGHKMAHATRLLAMAPGADVDDEGADQ